jgi:hypothetical protein
MKVKEIMKKVVTISRKATIKEAAALMSKKGIGFSNYCGRQDNPRHYYRKGHYKIPFTF